MNKEIIEELFEGVIVDFDKHLQMPNNDRIVFSGKYGAGKTTFMDYYFRKNSGDYNIIKLNPVDYSIAINEDVFKYIKYDILYNLLENNRIDFESFDFSKIETGTQFLKDNILETLSTFLPLIPQFGGSIDNVYQNLKNLNKKYVDYHSSITKNEEEEEVDEFMSEIVNQEGSIYENNLVTQIIKRCLLEYKVGESQNILIIDDLDRIDPNHIFRLFNVFATHLNENNNLQNKFGFDKVVFVCDIENVRNIFKNRYGANVDFNGYIDKFYSRKIFYYNGNAEVEKYSKKLIKGIDFRFESELVQDHWGNAGVGRGDFYRELVFIVSKLVMVNKLNLRRLLKEKDEYIYENQSLFFSSIDNKVPDRQNWQLNSVLVIEFLLALLGEKNDLIEALEACVNENDTQLIMEKGILCHILALTKVRDHKFEREVKLDFPYNRYTINGELVTGFRADFTRLDYMVNKSDAGLVMAGSNLNDDTDYNLFNLYLEGIKILTEIGYLK